MPYGSRFRRVAHRAVPAILVACCALSSPIAPAADAPLPTLRASELVEELRVETGDVLVLFTSDDPRCSFCVPANREAPPAIAGVSGAWRSLRVEWSPWPAFPTALGDLGLQQPLAGIPALVMFRDGRENWRIAGWAAGTHAAHLDEVLRWHAAGQPQDWSWQHVPTADRVTGATGGRAGGSAARTTTAGGASTAAPRAASATPPPRPTGAPPKNLAALVLSPDAPTVLVDSVVTLGASGRDAAGKPVVPLTGLEWSSSDPAVATVDPSGRVTGQRRGSVTITAKAGAVQARATVRVEGYAQLAVLGEPGSACAIPDSRAALYCWGQGLPLPWPQARLAFEQPTAVPLGELPSNARIAAAALAASYGCLLTEAGAAYCWGRGRSLGVGDEVQRPLPTAVQRGEIPAGVKLVTIATGPSAACAAGDDGQLYCWGGVNSLPTGRRHPSNAVLTAPAATERGEIPAGARIDAVSLNVNGGCALAAGEAYCWRGRDVPARAPRGAIAGGTRLVALEVGNLVGVLGDDGRAYLSGGAKGSMLGQGDDAFVSTREPLLVRAGAVPPGVRLVKLALSSSAAANCALGDDGRAYCWGTNYLGSAGTGDAPTRGVPVPEPAPVVAGEVPADAKLVDLACGRYHCAVLDDGGRAYTWGSNESGALGVGTRGARNASGMPVRVGPPVLR